MVLAAGTGAAVLFAASLALSGRTGMWLDEAQTLSISALAPADLLDALRTDGAPPLYYLVLHAWMALVGTSEAAARSLSAVFAVGAVALVPLAGERFGGRRAAGAAALLLATAPFMHRYATEARMYTLVVLLTLAGFLALSAALERPSTPSLAAVALVTGLLLLTHYWAFFLLAAVAGMLVAAARRPAGGEPARRVLAAMALGCLLFLPWLPTFAYQLRHTGAPWGSAAGGWMFEATLQGFAGGHGRIGLLGVAYLALFAVGLFGRPLPGGRIELDFGGRPGARSPAVVVGATLALALVASELTDAAFAPRYAAVVLAPFLLLVARGLAMVEHRRAAVVLAAAVAVAGVVRSADEVTAPRTQARRIAAAVEARAGPGDVVAFCPDQLAPSVVRLLSSAGVTPVAFPPGGPVERVNWVDYRRQVAASDSQEFAASLHHRAGGANVWLAWAPGYHSLGRKCELVLQGLRRLRPAGARQQPQDVGAFEHASLWRFPPNSGPPANPPTNP